MQTKTQKDFTATIVVDQSPENVFKAIQNFRGWWSEDIEGKTDVLNEVFLYRHKDIHQCKLKLIEAIPNNRLVYHVLDNKFSIFTKDETEWIDTKLVFDLASEGKKTTVKFTHMGLVPSYECYDVCNDAWTAYIKNSLYSLITTGKGQPTPKGEDGINADLMRKRNLVE